MTAPAPRRTLPRPLAWIRARADAVELAHLSAGAWAGTLAAIVALRHLLEIATGHYPVYSPVQFFVHYPLAYLAPLLALVLVLALFSGERVERVARLMLFAWLLTLLPPLVDLLLGRPGGGQIGYLVGEGSGGQPGFLELLARFFDPSHSFPGATGGIRVETALACLLAGLYVKAKGRGWVRAAACAAVVLPVALAFFTLPVRVAQLAGPPLGASTLGAFYGRAGRIASVPPAAIADLVISVYLVALVLLLALAFLRMRRRDAGGGPARGPALLLRFGSIEALGPAAGALIGAVAARPIAPMPGPGEPAAAEAFAILGAVLAALCAGAMSALPGATDESAESRPAVTTGLALAALALGACLGPTPFALTAALLALRLFDLLPPLALSSRAVLVEASAAAATVTAGLLGAAIFFGDEAIARMPPTLIFALAAGGVLLRVGGRGGEGAVRALRAISAAMAALAVPVLLGQTAALLPAIFFGAAAALVVSVAGSRMLSRVAPLAAAAAFALAGCVAAGTPEASVVLREESLRSAEWHLRRGEAALRQDMAARAASPGTGPITPRSEVSVRAEAHFREALRRNPDLVPALSQLGQMMLSIGQTNEAITLLQHAVEEDRRSVRTLADLSAGLVADGQFDRAISTADEALLADPRDCNALANRAVAWERKSPGSAESRAAQARYAGCGDR